MMDMKFKSIFTGDNFVFLIAEHKIIYSLQRRYKDIL